MRVIRPAALARSRWLPGWLAGPSPSGADRRAALELERLLGPALDDLYALILLPRLPIRGSGLTGVLVGPPGVRAMTVRRWGGSFRLRGRGWEVQSAAGDWIAVRDDPGADATALAEGIARWAIDTGLGPLPVSGTVVFPRRQTQIVLEEPGYEVVRVDNAPWWANSIGRSQRLDAARVTRVVEAILVAGDALAAANPEVGESPARGRVTDA